MHRIHAPARALGIATLALAIAGCGSPQIRAGGDLLDAASSGDISAVRQRIAEGADLDQRRADGTTPLMFAAIFGHTEVAALLIDNGAALEPKNSNGSTALAIAAFFGWPETTKLLIDRGADVEALDNNQATPLDTVSTAWSPELEGVYRYFGGLLQTELDLERIREARPKIVAMLEEAGSYRNY